MKHLLNSYFLPSCQKQFKTQKYKQKNNKTPKTQTQPFVVFDTNMGWDQKKQSLLTEVQYKKKSIDLITSDQAAK